MTSALIIDGEAGMRDWLRNILGFHSYQNITDASTYTEGLFMFNALEPEVVIMDLKIPFYEALRALNYMKSKSPDTAVIICSYYTTNKVIDQCAIFGAYDFIKKPHFRRLSAALEKLTSNQESPLY